jgi:hypothetical protein
LDLDNLSHLNTFFVLAMENFPLARLQPVVWGSRALKIPILLKVTIRSVAVVLCELAIVNCLREILNLRF